MMVDSMPSLLLASREERIPIARDHSEMAKFATKSESAYQSLVHYIAQALENIRPVEGYQGNSFSTFVNGFQVYKKYRISLRIPLSVLFLQYI